MLKFTLTFDDKKTGLAPRRRFLLQREEPFDLRIRRRGDDFGHYSACSLFSFLRTFSGRICGKKIPYCCEVGIESFKEGAERYDIGAVIYVMRESQKGIIIGRQGAALKKVGTQARIDMEDFFQKKVFLQIYVKVDPDWRESRRELRKFGYED